MPAIVVHISAYLHGPERSPKRLASHAYHPVSTTVKLMPCRPGFSGTKRPEMVYRGELLIVSDRPT